MFNLIYKLSCFWSGYGCKILTPSRRRIGAATFHPHFIYKMLRGSKISVAYVQPTYRPFDYDFGLNNKYQRYHQFQVVLMNNNLNVPKTFELSLRAVGITDDCRVILRKSEWQSASLCAVGSGWECLLNNVEVAQITSFDQICSTKCDVTTWEIAYGLERLQFALTGRSIKPNAVEIAKSESIRSSRSLHYFLRFKVLVTKLKSLNPQNIPHYYSTLLDIVDVYNRLYAKRSVKRSVTRIILTKIQHHIRLMALQSTKC
ncbi:MAG: glycine--tRNA ligase subunit alpha [Candidatus Hodgkinia cicadicola]